MHGTQLREYIKTLVAMALREMSEDEEKVVDEAELQEFSGAGGGGGNTVANAMGGSSLGGHMGSGNVRKHRRRKKSTKS